MEFDLKKEFEKVLKPIAGDTKSRLSDSVLKGTIMEGQPIEIEVDWIISGDINRSIYDKKLRPIGENNQSKILKQVGNFQLDGMELELVGVGKKVNNDGIKHIFRYEVHFVDKPEKGLTEIIVPMLKDNPEEEKVVEKKVIKNKFKEVKDYGKNTINSK